MHAIIGYIIGVIGLAGFAFGVACYLELRKWARLCKYSRIAIAYKRRVQTQAPIVDWIKWVQLLNDDEASNGRLIYRNGGTSVVITRTIVPPNRLVAILHRKRSTARIGKWRSRDDTKTTESASK